MTSRRQKWRQNVKIVTLTSCTRVVSTFPNPAGFTEIPVGYARKCHPLHLSSFPIWCLGHDVEFLGIAFTSTLFAKMFQIYCWTDWKSLYYSVSLSNICHDITDSFPSIIRGDGDSYFRVWCQHNVRLTLFARSFRRRFFAYHYAVNHPHTNIILSWFSIPLVLKCVAKILKIGLQIKI